MSFLSDDAVRRLREAGHWPEFPDGRYAALETIGRGGMGTVFRATDAALGREVAIKVSSAVAPGSDLETRLGTEATVLARLEHPGIVPVHDAGRLADGRLFVVMKLVRGETLERHLEQVPDLADRLRIFERVCEPVSFAHDRGFVHRDLKPSNVMIGAFGEVLVMDWGVAKLLRAGGSEAGPAAGAVPAVADGGAGTAAGTVVGTRGFMAPEQASASAVDRRADVYGLGAILFTLLAGVPPGGAAAPSLEPLRSAPRPLRAICARALAAEPEGRYPTAQALAADVARFRAGQPVHAHRENPFERAGRVLYRYRGAVLLIVAYLVMRAVVAVLLHR